MSAHDRFESLAGAVALGEATPQEREAFDAHASQCAACREDAAGGAFVVAQIAASREAETWRPSQPIVDRLRAKSGARSRHTMNVLGWAVAASLVLNVAVAGGVGSQLVGAFTSVPAAPANVVAQRITFDAPHPPAAARVALAFPRARLVPPHHEKHVARVPSDAIAAVAKPIVPPAEKFPTLDDIPDQLAGVDLYGTGTTHHVAVATLPRCTKARDDDATSGKNDQRPCRDARGRIER